MMSDDGKWNDIDDMEEAPALRPGQSTIWGSGWFAATKASQLCSSLKSTEVPERSWNSRTAHDSVSWLRDDNIMLLASTVLTSTHIYSLGDQETGTSTPSRSQLLWWGKSHLYLPGKPWDLDPWSSAAALWSWSSCHTYKDVHKDAACSMNRNED